MSEEDRTKYINAIKNYAAYNKDSNYMDIPSSYDCADVATYLNSKASEGTSQEGLYKQLTHNGDAIGEGISSIQSSDYFTEQTNNITFYEDKSFNNQNVEPGTVLVWKNEDSSQSWTGHVATVVGVTRDNDGNVTNIKIIQGHTGGSKTEVVDIVSQSDLDEYRGTFLGFGEIGKDSTTKKNK